MATAQQLKAQIATLQEQAAAMDKPELLNKRIGALRQQYITALIGTPLNMTPQEQVAQLQKEIDILQGTLDNSRGTPAQHTRMRDLQAQLVQAQQAAPLNLTPQAMMQEAADYLARVEQANAETGGGLKQKLWDAGNLYLQRAKQTGLGDPGILAHANDLNTLFTKESQPSAIQGFVDKAVPIGLKLAAAYATGDALGFNSFLGAQGTAGAEAAGATGAGAGAAAADPYLASIAGASGVTPAMEAAGALSASTAPGVAASTAAANAATGLSYNSLINAASTMIDPTIAAMGGDMATQQVLQQAAQQGIGQEVLKQAATNPTILDQVKQVVSGKAAPPPGWVSAAGALLPTLANAISPVPTPPPNVSTSQNVYSPAEQAQRDYMLAEARRVYDAAVAAEIAGGNPNAAVAPQSPDTIAAQNALRQFATGAATDMTKEQQAAQTYGLTTAMDVNANPYLQKAIQAALNPLTQSYTDTGGVLSKIRSESLQSGQYGGTRQGLGEGVAAGRYLQTVGDTAAKMSSDAYNKGQDTFARTLALSPSLVQAGQQPAQMLSAIGTQNEAYQQEVENAKAQGKQWDLTKGFQPLQNFTNLVNASSNPVATATAPPTPAPRKNLVGDAISGAILANQVWGALNKAGA